MYIYIYISKYIFLHTHIFYANVRHRHNKSMWFSPWTHLMWVIGSFNSCLIVDCCVAIRCFLCCTIPRHVIAAGSWGFCNLRMQWGQWVDSLVLKALRFTARHPAIRKGLDFWRFLHFHNKIVEFHLCSEQVGSRVFIHGLVSWRISLCIRLARSWMVMATKWFHTSIPWENIGGPSININTLPTKFRTEVNKSNWSSKCFQVAKVSKCSGFSWDFRWLEVSKEGQRLNLKAGRVVAPEDDGRLGVVIQGPGGKPLNISMGRNSHIKAVHHGSVRSVAVGRQFAQALEVTWPVQSWSAKVPASTMLFSRFRE